MALIYIANLDINLSSTYWHKFIKQLFAELNRGVSDCWYYLIKQLLGLFHQAIIGINLSSNYWQSLTEECARCHDLFYQQLLASSNYWHKFIKQLLAERNRGMYSVSLFILSSNYWLQAITGIDFSCNY